MKGLVIVKKLSLKITALLLVLTMVLSVASVFAFANQPAEADAATVKTVTLSEDEATSQALFSYLTDPDVNPEECSNSVVIPGVFQSKTALYNEDGTLALNSEGEPYEAPFFLESTNDIVKVALKECLFPLLLTLITQHDWNGMLAKKVSAVLGEVLGAKAQNNSKGEFIYNVKADKYEGSVAECTEEEKEYIYDQIPLNDYAEICGEEHLYFYSYCSFGNINSLVDELYAYIKKAAAASPTGKANIVPISQGGSLAVNLLERYPEVGQYLDRIIFIVPAADGTMLLGEIFEFGLIDDDEALYNEMFPILIADDDTPWLGHLINIVLRILPNSAVNGLIDEAIDVLAGEYLRYSTTIWALLPSKNYPAAAKKYLNENEDAFIRAQTDVHYQAQLDHYDNILYQIETYGVEVFDIADYNVSLYPIVDSWDDVNGDGVIHLDSTSFGATSYGVDVTLPSSYTPVEGGKYVDPHKIVDAGTGLLPDHTFYFHNQNHERTASNDVIMKLAISLLTDNNFTSVNSYPDRYPQFNESRDGRDLTNAVKAAKAIDASALSAEDAQELAAAIAEGEAQIEKTAIDPEASVAAEARLNAIRDKINGVTVEEPTFSDKVSDGANEALTSFIVAFSNFLYRFFGGKGFSDIILFR